MWACLKKARMCKKMENQNENKAIFIIIAKAVHEELPDYMRRSLMFKDFNDHEVKVGPMDLDTFMIITEQVVQSTNPESTGLQWIWE
jgi:hypothetical protein